jgi:hypothetical protein
VLLQPLGHLSVRLGSTVYRAAGRPVKGDRDDRHDFSCRLSYRSLYRHGEAAGAQFVRGTRQTVRQPEHDVEARSIRNRGRGEVDVNRTGTTFRRLQRDEWPCRWQRKGHEVRGGWSPRRHPSCTLANPICAIRAANFACSHGPA